MIVPSFLLFALSLFTATDAPRIIPIKYVGLTYGYEVTGSYIPREQIMSTVLGDVRLEFAHRTSGHTFNVSTIDYPIAADQLDVVTIEGDEAMEVVDFSTEPVVLHYLPPENSVWLNVCCPYRWYFKDVTFDGKRELLLPTFDKSYRSPIYYEVHRFTGPSRLPKRVTMAPFEALEELAELLPDEQQLAIHYTAGYCTGTVDYYTRQADGRFVRTKQVVRSRYDVEGLCLESTYRIVDDSPVLIGLDTLRN